MSGTLRTLLGARATAVIGRHAERAVLLGLVEPDRPLVVAVHGIAGIGKSALLAAFAEHARAHGAAIVTCSGIEQHGLQRLPPAQAPRCGVIYVAATKSIGAQALSVKSLTARRLAGTVSGPSGSVGVDGPDLGAPAK